MSLVWNALVIRRPFLLRLFANGRMHEYEHGFTFEGSMLYALARAMNRPPDSIVQHQAGEPNHIRAVQYCDLCGAVLVDNRGAMVQVGSGGPRYFEPGSLVVKGPGFVSASKDSEALPCSQLQSCNG